MSSRIYIEGGGDSKDLRTRCREGFRRLLERIGLSGRMPRLVACGARTSLFRDFLTAHRRSGANAYVAMLLDSEEPMEDIDRPWEHLHKHDGWIKPDGADDQQVLMMTTCMETWIVCDRQTLRAHYGSCLQETALPSLTELESRSRDDVQDSLAHATRECRNRYVKGKRSFEIVGKLQPDVLRRYLPSFKRCTEILDNEL